MTPLKYPRVLVTGAAGFLGRHVVEALRKDSRREVIAVGRRECDLLQPGAPAQLLRDSRPDAVLHLAAKVGGIIANRDYPADFYYENVTINTQVLEATYRAGVKRFLSFIGGCSYPARAASPIGEESMWSGYPQAESAPYSLAKRVLLVQADAYREQHGFNASVVIPGNVYGEHDNFNFEYAHVVPAMIRRFVEAREAGRPRVVCYGSGRPTRDFVYARDVAELIPWFLESYDSGDPVNISSGTRTSIRELAETVRKVTGFGGEIRWDTSKPDGQMDKIFDVARLKKLGMSCDTPLREGLAGTTDWFLAARERGEVRL